MRTLLLIVSTLFISSCLSLASCQFKSKSIIKGNKEITKKEYSISDYDEIDTGGAKKIYYKLIESDSPKLTIEIDNNLLQYIKVYVKDGELRIDTDNTVSISPTTFKVYTNSKQLNALDISGACSFETDTPIKGHELDISVSGACKVTFLDTVDVSSIGCEASGASKIFFEKEILANEFDIDASGASHTKLSSIKAHEIDCDASGASSITIAGNATKVEFDASGRSKIEAKDLVANSVKCEASGVSKITAHVTDELEASASGTSSISYIGDPIKRKNSTSGVSKIKPIE